MNDGEGAERRFTFSAPNASRYPEAVNMSDLLEESVLQLRKEVPLQIVVNMFQKMVGLHCSDSFYEAELFLHRMYDTSCSRKKAD